MNNIDSYDMIFFSYPNWRGTMPMAVFTFLEEHNLAGKTIVPFCAHGGSYFCESINDVKKLCPNSAVLEGLAVRGSDIKNVTNFLIYPYGCKKLDFQTDLNLRRKHEWQGIRTS
ncbi:MAG: hypothetical protein LE168_05285 [Endomicrobium sp.]|nr:hypothetical protein [Endomicrobium sp.]